MQEPWLWWMNEKRRAIAISPFLEPRECTQPEWILNPSSDVTAKNSQKDTFWIFFNYKNHTHSIIEGLLHISDSFPYQQPWFLKPVPRVIASASDMVNQFNVLSRYCICDEYKGKKRQEMQKLCLSAVSGISLVQPSASFFLSNARPHSRNLLVLKTPNLNIRR